MPPDAAITVVDPHLQNNTKHTNQIKGIQTVLVSCYFTMIVQSANR